jgi:hypothetical protein
VPTDLGAQFCGREIVNAVLIVGRRVTRGLGSQLGRESWLGLGAQAGFGSQDGAGFGARICSCLESTTGLANSQSDLGLPNGLVENDMSAQSETTEPISFGVCPGTAWG